MPYFVHAKDSEPTDESTRYTSRAEAYRVISDSPGGRAVTFVISEDERKEWKTREYRRFRDNVYSLPPWIESIYRCWEPSDSADTPYQYPALAHHFAHLSLKTPGCIAYTKSDEDGYQDRQTTIKVGRYLEQYAKEYFTPERIARYVDGVKAYSEDLQLARTAEDIETVYRNTHSSFGSCMSHPTSDYSTQGIHPTAVYGDSDLALAYLGSMESPSARCIVWPEKKRFTRIYGDTTLRSVMEKAGYSYLDGQNYGNLHGAKVRAIKVPGRSYYVMPYVDAATSADLEGQWFILRDDDSGEYDVHNSDYTDGITHEKTHHTCAQCHEECDEDESLCSSCEDDRICCQRCGESYFDASSDGRYIADDWYCESCADNHYSHECDGCGDSWDEVRPNSSYCEDCRDHYIDCSECGDTLDTRECESSGDLCDNCYAKRQEDEDDTVDEDGQTEDTSAPLVLSTSDGIPSAHSFEDVYPTIDTTIFVNWGTGKRIAVDVLYLSGVIALHHKTEDDPNLPPFVLTHVPSGLIVCRMESSVYAIDLAQLLSTPGIDWGFTDSAHAPTSTRELTRYIVRNRVLPTGDCLAAQLLRNLNPSSTAEVSCPV